MNENFSKVLEWAVWANLDRYTDAELLLLKGHLILEVFIDRFLEEEDFGKYRNISFHKKVTLISEVLSEAAFGLEITDALFSLNKIRNKFAHKWKFSLDLSGIDDWANEVLARFPVIKHTKYTYRTKLVHAFVALSSALMACKNGSNKAIHPTPKDAQL